MIQKIKPRTKIPNELFFEIFDFCANGSAYLTVNEMIYKQKERLDMVVHLAPTLFSTASEYKIEDTFSVFNSFSPKLKFTHELQDQFSGHDIDS